MLGYDRDLYMLAFDHRGSFQKQLLGITGVPTPEEAARISDTKALIFEGFLEAHATGKLGDGAGILVDEEFGAPVARRAKEMGIVLAMPAEASGRDEFDFGYGDDFARHIEAFDPTFTKVLVRYNPEGDPGVERTADGAASSSGGLAARARAEVPLRAPGARHRRAARRRRGRPRALRSRGPTRPRRAFDRRSAGRRRGGRRLEDRGARRACRLPAGSRAGPPRGT